MFKKIIGILMLSLLCSPLASFGNSRALAQDVYMGNYVDGNQIWLMSETIQIEDLRHFKARVKSVREGRLVRYIDYVFWGGVGSRGGEAGFKASDGRSGRFTSQLDEWSPVEHNISNYYKDVWQDYISGRRSR